MSLTLVELAQAITDEKLIEFEDPIDSGQWFTSLVSELKLSTIINMIKHGDIRIKPEPKEYWIVSWKHSLGDIMQHDICELMPEAIPRGATVRHVMEVIE